MSQVSSQSTMKTRGEFVRQWINDHQKFFFKSIPRPVPRNPANTLDHSAGTLNPVASILHQQPASIEHAPKTFNRAVCRPKPKTSQGSSFVDPKAGDLFRELGSLSPVKSCRDQTASSAPVSQVLGRSLSPISEGWQDTSNPETIKPPADINEELRPNVLNESLETLIPETRNHNISYSNQKADNAPRSSPLSGIALKDIPIPAPRCQILGPGSMHYYLSAPIIYDSKPIYLGPVVAPPFRISPESPVYYYTTRTYF